MGIRGADTGLVRSPGMGTWRHCREVRIMGFMRDFGLLNRQSVFHVKHVSGNSRRIRIV